MKATVKSPSYLVRNPYSYCFRMIVPKDLQKFVGKTELRYTLGTGNLRIAKHKAILVAGQVHLIFNDLRKGYTALSKLSDDQIRELVHQYIKDQIDNWDTRIYEPWDLDDVNFQPPFVDAETLNHYIEDLDDIRRDWMADLQLGNFKPVERSIKSLLKKSGINKIDKKSLEYRKLGAKVLQAQIQLIPMEKKHMLSDFSYKQELPTIFPEVFGPSQNQIENKSDPSLQNEIEKDSDLLSYVIRHYVAENEVSNWSGKTKDEIESSLNLFIKVMGDVPIRSIKRKRVSEFKAALQKLPPNMNKMKEYRDKSIKELLEMDIEKTLAVTTINKHLTRVSSLFNHALRNGFLDGTNPASDMNLPKTKTDDEYRAPFDPEELKLLMRSETYMTDSHRKCYQFWIPIIALFTGMRQDEIAQLHLDDIRMGQDRVWVIDVNNRKEKKTQEQIKQTIDSDPFLYFRGFEFYSICRKTKILGRNETFP